MDYDDKEDLEQIDENTQPIYAYLKALHSGVLFIAWCCIAADIVLFLILIKMLSIFDRPIAMQKPDHGATANTSRNATAGC
jgi:hypothetical protein